MIDNIAFTISLPRTGTVSICSMFQFLGYKTSHAPLSAVYNIAKIGMGFADTPCFAPSVVEHFSKIDNVKFIYIDRDFDSWLKSMTQSTNLLRTYSRLLKYPQSDLKNGQDQDVKYYGEVFGEFNMAKPEFYTIIEKRFYEHRDKMLEYKPLVYKFDQGWEPLCEFLNVNTPTKKEIPHLHKAHIGTQK